MNKKPPTKEQFEAWSKDWQTSWIKFEISGKTVTPEMPGWLFYEIRDFSIRFSFNDDGTLKEVKTMPLKTGLDELNMFMLATSANYDQN